MLHENSIKPSYVTPSQNADVSSYLKQRSLIFLFRLPAEVDKFDTILSPLQGKAWIATCSTVAIFLIFLYLLSKADGVPDWRESRTYHVASISIVTLINEALPPAWFIISDKFRRSVW